MKSWSVTIQMKATEQYFPVELLIMLHTAHGGLTFETVPETLKSWSFKWKLYLAIKQYFPVVLFIMLYKVVLTFESVDKILKCDHANESYYAQYPCAPMCGAVYLEIWEFKDVHFLKMFLKQQKYLRSMKMIHHGW